MNYSASVSRALKIIALRNIIDNIHGCSNISENDWLIIWNTGAHLPLWHSMSVGWKPTICVPVVEAGWSHTGLSFRNVTSGFIHGNIRSQHKERLQTYMFCATVSKDKDCISYRSGKVFRLLPCTQSSSRRGKYIEILGNTYISLSLHLNIFMLDSPTRNPSGISEIILWPISNSANVARLDISVIFVNKLWSRCTRRILSSPLICSRGIWGILLLLKYSFLSRLQWLKLGKLLILLFMSFKTPNRNNPAIAFSETVHIFWFGMETHDKEGDDMDTRGNMTTVP